MALGTQQVPSDTQHTLSAPSPKHSALLLGYGRIGQAVASVAARERDRLRAAGVELELVRALVRDLEKPRGGPAIPLANRFEHLISPELSVVIEALGGIEPARTLVAAALRAGIPVVSANKTLVAAHGPDLRALAVRHQTTFACDAAVLAGVPFLGSLTRRPLVSAARRIEGILNGTSHFILTALAQRASFADALSEAIDRGYAEPDSSADISGRDAAEKLTILLHLAGYADVRAEDLTRCSLETLEPEDLVAASSLGGAIKPVVLASTEAGSSGAWVGPAFVAEEHPFARLASVTNALRLKTAAGTCTFSGPGAGPEVTATTILDDVVESLTCGAAWPGAEQKASSGLVVDAFRTPPRTRWFLHLTGGSDENHASITDALSWPVICGLLAELRKSHERVLALPVIDGGRGE